MADSLIFQPQDEAGKDCAYLEREVVGDNLAHTLLLLSARISQESLLRCFATVYVPRSARLVTIR